MAEIRSVESKDGVPIACWMSGRGPHLVLVHGTTADHTRWSRVLPMLERHFTVCAVDRRGRGRSGDAPEYALELEFDDIAAVCEALDGPVHLLGHSYGALCALEAAPRTQNLGRMVLYEPAIPTEGPLYPPGVRARLERLLERGERDRVLTIFFREVVQMPEEELTMLRADPSWQVRLSAAHTIPRELADEDYVLEPRRFAEMRTPTLLLLGGDSPRFLRMATDAVDAALPDSRIEVMPGQQHVAMTTAPDLFAGAVLRFLLS